MDGVPFHDDATERNLILSISHDITERKRAEEKIQRLNRLYTVSSGINEAIVRGARDPSPLRRAALSHDGERGGLGHSSWVGALASILRRSAVQPVARWGRDEGPLDAIRISSSVDVPDRPCSGPVGQAFRTGAIACCPDIAADTGSFATKAEALQRGYRSCAAFPLKIEGHTVGALVAYGDQRGLAFDDGGTPVAQCPRARTSSFAAEAHRQEAQRRAGGGRLLRASAAAATSRSLSMRRMASSSAILESYRHRRQCQHLPDARLYP